MPTTHTSRTLKHLKNEGYLAAVVERWVPRPGLSGGGFRMDYLNFADIIAFNGNTTLAVQSCGGDFSQHFNKLMESHEAYLWVNERAHRELLLIGWRKLKVKRGGKLMKWTPRIMNITRNIFEAEMAMRRSSITTEPLTQKNSK